MGKVWVVAEAAELQVWLICHAAESVLCCPLWPVLRLSPAPAEATIDLGAKNSSFRFATGTHQRGLQHASRSRLSPAASNVSCTSAIDITASGVGDCDCSA